MAEVVNSTSGPDAGESSDPTDSLRRFLPITLCTSRVLCVGFGGTWHLSGPVPFFLMEMPVPESQTESWIFLVPIFRDFALLIFLREILCCPNFL